MMYLIIEQADGLEIIGINLYRDIAEATERFELCAKENLAHELPPDELGLCVAGTLRIAGDDAYCVSLVETVPL